MNRFILAGTCLSKNKGLMVLETVERTPSNPEGYKETHPISIDNKALKDVNPGKRYRVTGTLVAKVNPETNKGVTILEADAVPTVWKDAEDKNLARATGLAYRSTEFYGRTETSAAFANLLVLVGKDMIIRGVAFQNLAHRLDRTCKRGAELQLQGRIRHRLYESKGVEGVMVEVVADPDWTKVIKEAVMVDEFADEAKAAGDKQQAI